MRPAPRKQSAPGCVTRFTDTGSPAERECPHGWWREPPFPAHPARPNGETYGLTTCLLFCRTPGRRRSQEKMEM